LLVLVVGGVGFCSLSLLMLKHCYDGSALRWFVVVIALSYHGGEGCCFCCC